VSDPREHGKGWIGVDFDSTLAHYTGYKGPDHVGEPIKPMVDRVKKWLKAGKDVRIFTARDAKSYPAIRRFCMENFGKTLKITKTKDRFMEVLYDDRAVQVEPNTGKIIGD
jgi:hypothetical protein